MSKLLYIKANIKPEGQSRTFQVADGFIEEYKRLNPNDEVIVRDLYNENIDFFAFDLSKDAINVAARGMNNICFFVSDIQSIPLKDNSIDCMLNIYTPANYPEFKRVLKKDGYFITSGIIHDRVDMVTKKLEEVGFEVLEINKDGEWNCIVAKLK